MDQGLCNITYQNQVLQVEEITDINNEEYYKIPFPNDGQIDIYVTPARDGIAPDWVEGKGEHTNRAKETGELIVAHQL